MENLGVFIIIIIFMILRGLYRQSQEQAQRQRQGNVRPVQSQPPRRFEPYDQKRHLEPEPALDEKDLWYEEEAATRELTVSEATRSMPDEVFSDEQQKKVGETQESLETIQKSEMTVTEISEKQEPVSLASEKPVRKGYYVELLKDPRTIRDAVVLSEILHRRQF